jgi:hypothetical protein
MWNIFILLAAVFVGYAMWKYYQTTPGTSVPGRVWASLMAAGTALLAYAMAWLQTPPPAAP